MKKIASQKKTNVAYGRRIALIGVSGLLLFCAGACDDTSSKKNDASSKESSNPYVMALNKAKITNCDHNLSQIYLSLKNYEIEHGRFPSPDGAAGLAILQEEGLIQNAQIFTCPNAKRTPGSSNETISEKNCPFIYFGSGMSSTMNPPMPLLFDRPENHGTSVQVLWTNGEITKEKGQFKNVSALIASLLKKHQYPARMQNGLKNKSLAWDRANRG